MILIENITTCLIFNIVGLGFYYYIDLYAKAENKFNKAGTAVFFGWGAATLFAYLFWLIIPNHLNFVCYFVFLISLIGVVFLIQKKDINFLLKSDYFIALVFLIPFIGLFHYSPLAWDEFSYWLIGPKSFYYANSLSPNPPIGFPSYTPLWTFQVTFFQYFISSDFNESINYAFRVNLILAFLFFIKEITKSKNLITFLLVIGVLLVFYAKINERTFVYYTVPLLIELPLYIILTSVLFLGEAIERYPLENQKEKIVFLYIMLISAYMFKTPLFLFTLAGVYLIWIYRGLKQVLYFIFLFSIFYFSWKFKTDIFKSFGAVSLSSLKAERTVWNPLVFKEIYYTFLQNLYGYRVYHISFIISMVSIYRHSRNLFKFYFYFSILYYTGLIISYFFIFSEEEGKVFANYIRYLSVLLVPAYIFGLYTILTQIQKLFNFKPFSKKIILNPNYITSGCVGLIVGTISLCELDIDPVRDYRNGHIGLSFGKKIKDSEKIQNKKIIVIDQAGLAQYYLGPIRYVLKNEKKDPDISFVNWSSYGSSEANINFESAKRDEVLRKDLENYDIIIVIKSDIWLNNILSELTHQNINNISEFSLIKREDNYKILNLL